MLSRSSRSTRKAKVRMKKFYYCRLPSYLFQAENTQRWQEKVSGSYKKQVNIFSKSSSIPTLAVEVVGAPWDRSATLQRPLETWLRHVHCLEVKKQVGNQYCPSRSFGFCKNPYEYQYFDQYSNLESRQLMSRQLPQDQLNLSESESGLLNPDFHQSEEREFGRFIHVNIARDQKWNVIWG